MRAIVGAKFQRRFNRRGEEILNAVAAPSGADTLMPRNQRQNAGFCLWSGKS